MIESKKWQRCLWLLLITCLLAACQAPAASVASVPTLLATAPPAATGSPTPDATRLAALRETVAVAPTWTPAPGEALATATPFGPVGTRPATATPPLLPTITPITFTPTPRVTAVPSATPTSNPAAPEIDVVVKPFNQYGMHEIVAVESFPRPAGDNGWGMHWIPTPSQHPSIVDRFVEEAVNMHIKWVVFLNNGSNIGDNDYLVDRLVANGIMPVMRVFLVGVRPVEGDLGAMVRHYRARGVIYFQLYNEPNVDDENQGFVANPNQYASVWADAARDVLNNGGLPGIGALSPGGSYNHYTFLERTLQALIANGDVALLNRAWLSVHNYHGLRAFDDPDGFFLFRNYDIIVRRSLGRPMAMIGTEAGSYSSNPHQAKDHLIFQYTYMREAEPYFLAHSYWLLANYLGGGGDPAWEWQTLFRQGWTHPVVTEFFYVNTR